MPSFESEIESQIPADSLTYLFPRHWSGVPIFFSLTFACHYVKYGFVKLSLT